MSKSNWKQASPKDQAVVILGALEGWASNLADGSSPIERAVPAMMVAITDLKELCKYLPLEWKCSFPSDNG